MSLSDWQKNGWLTPHITSAREIADLLAVVERDLADSAAEGVSADWRMNIAYNAGLQAATAAFRKKRNITGYERVGVVSDADAAEMRKLASRLRDDVVTWLRGQHTNLMK